MNHKGNIALIPLVLVLLVIIVLFATHKTSPGTAQTSTVPLKTQYQNPFDKSSQYVNPFSTYKNPLDNLR